MNRFENLSEQKVDNNIGDSKEKNLSTDEIFKHREKYIPEIGEQLKKESLTKINVNGEQLEIDYRVISVKEKLNEKGRPVILVQGFGSGWEGISELGFSLACEGRKVIMLSLPGYGNSETPSKEYQQQNDFSNESEVIDQLLSQLQKEKDIEDQKVHLIGHSMGSEIITEFADKHPEKVKSIVLLNPAGIKEKENSFSMGTKFIASGIHTNAEHKLRSIFNNHGEKKDYQTKLHDYIPEVKGPFSKQRISQRIAEIKKLSKGNLIAKIKKIEQSITYISGEKDIVYPPGKKEDSGSQLNQLVNATNQKSRIEKSIILSLRHNTTIAPDEITAANIEHYLEQTED